MSKHEDSFYTCQSSADPKLMRKLYSNQSNPNDKLSCAPLRVTTQLSNLKGKSANKSVANDTTYLTARQDDQDLLCDEELAISDEERFSLAQKFAPKISKIEYECSQQKYNPELAFIQTPAEEDEKDCGS